jgi:hypothetical protein
MRWVGHGDKRNAYKDISGKARRKETTMRITPKWIGWYGLD